MPAGPPAVVDLRGQRAGGSAGEPVSARAAAWPRRPACPAGDAGGGADGRRELRRNGGMVAAEVEWAAWAACPRRPGAVPGAASPRHFISISSAPPRNSRFEDKNPKSKHIRKKLEEPISMSFNEETPLEDVLKYIKQATTTKRTQGYRFTWTPRAREAETTMTRTVKPHRARRHPAQNHPTADAQTTGPGLLRARRISHHQLAYAAS